MYDCDEELRLLSQGSISAQALLVRCVCYAAAGWWLVSLAQPSEGPSAFPSDPWSATGSMLQLALATALLSPLYATLTLSVSSDTVLACAVGLSIMHLYLADYHPRRQVIGPAASVCGSLSVASALGAAILTASRLRSVADVAAQLLLSLLAFVLWPYGCQQVRMAGAGAEGALTLLMALGAAATLSVFSVGAALLFGATLVFLGLLCPLWLVRAHKFKAKINGPWDEAVPRLGEEMMRETSGSV